MGYQTVYGFFCFFMLTVITAWSWEVVNFRWVKSDNGELMCGMSPPNKTLNDVATLGLCTASCLHVRPSPCHAVNYWKSSRICQHFYYIPCSYEVQHDCVNYQVTIIDFFEIRKSATIGFM